MNHLNILHRSRELAPVPSFGNTLIVGAGPAAIQVAVNISRWCDNIGLLNRKGSHSSKLKKELNQNNYTLTAKVQNEKYSHLAGKIKLCHFYDGYDSIDDLWKTLIICTPSDGYKDIINALRLETLQDVEKIILISPSIGSNLFINSQLKESKNIIDVISFSSYYAATKIESGDSGILSVLTMAVKKRIYIASNRDKSTAALAVKSFIEKLGIQCTILGKPIEAESKNIINYVHPPFVINEFSLREIFSNSPSKKYMYKLYPEGPITQHTIRSMVLLWKELSTFILNFGGKPINLLKFLNDDNYPVHEITLSREDIENFTQLEQVKQEYLLYIRYSSILIDPFSKPDENGKYYDFSAVPYKQVYKDKNDRWVFPRIPFEDYKKLKLIYCLAQKMNIVMPHTLSLVVLFENKFNQFIKEKGIESFYPEDLVDDIENVADAVFCEMEQEKCRTV